MHHTFEEVEHVTVKINITSMNSIERNELLHIEFSFLSPTVYL